MSTEAFAQQLRSTKEYFDRSSRCLTEENSGFAPSEGFMTAAQQVAHTAQTVDWFMEGGFRPEGFGLDFEGAAAEVAKVSSLKEAQAWLDRAFANAIDVIGSKSMDELQEPMAEGPVMGGAPRLAIVGAIADHTAHHRGALTVYSRLCGHTPHMPYMEEM